MKTVFLKAKYTNAYVSIRPDQLHESHRHMFDMEGRLTGDLQFERSAKSQEEAIQFYTEQLKYHEVTREDYFQARQLALLAVVEYREFYVSIPSSEFLAKQEEFLADLHNAA